MALFNNVSLVLLLLLAVSSIANARFLEVSSESESTGKPKVCSSCECKEENGKTRCYRTDSKFGGCPLVCGTRCLACIETDPPTCWCTYEVDTCSPSECAVNTVTMLENLLAYNMGD